MGLFGKLFEKKECAICGGEIGLLGNRKLEDGNLCKNCAAKLSPWFDDRRHSTVEQIREQLAYREENRKMLDRFSATRTFGERYQLFLDENQRKFLVAKTKDFRSENADVLDCSQVISCDLDISEMTNEEKREIKDQEGKTKKISYNPPRYTYTYNFNLKLKVNHPYFDDINFRLNDRSIEVRETGKPQFGRSPGRYDSGYQYFERMGEEIRRALMEGNSAAEDSSQQFASASTEGASVAAPETAPDSAPVAAKITCPYCGATVSAAKFCEMCGAPLK